MNNIHENMNIFLFIPDETLKYDQKTGCSFNKIGEK